MRVLILGGDGYLGWPTAMHLKAEGHDVAVVDNYFKLQICSEIGVDSLVPLSPVHERAEKLAELTGHRIPVHQVDCTDYEALASVVRSCEPDAVVHYAEQPSGPWSMMGHSQASRTLHNNVGSTLNLVWAVLRHAPGCHIVKLGTMGEYGTPNIDIPEGWLDIEHNGRKDKFLFPRQAGSLYHTTKILDTDLLHFYVRNYPLAVTDLMQGPVYGINTAHTRNPLSRDLLTRFHYDDVFGTLVNRFLVQAMCEMPLTVYGGGGQTRGYLNLVDTLRCVQLAVENPAEPGELRVFNQFTESLSVLEVAERVRDAGRELGLDVSTQVVDNPRKEREDHYYNAACSKLPELGLEPTLMTTEVLVEMMQTLSPYLDRVDRSKILPTVHWGQTE